MTSITASYYLFLDGLKGDARHPKHSGEFGLLDIWGMYEPEGDAHGRWVKRSGSEYFEFERRITTSNIKLGFAAANATLFPSGRITMYRFDAGGERIDRTIDLQNVIVNSFSTAEPVRRGSHGKEDPIAKARGTLIYTEMKVNVYT